MTQFWNFWQDYMNEEHHLHEAELSAHVLEESNGLAADVLRQELQQFDEDEHSDDIARSSKRSTQPNSDRSRSKRPRVRNDLMHAVAQQLVAAYLPTTNRAPNQAEGHVAPLLDLPPLPFTVPHQHQFPAQSSSTGLAAELNGFAGTAHPGGGARPPHSMARTSPTGPISGQVADIGRPVHAAETFDDRMHECELCGKRYKHRTHLTRHLRTHTGEKPFACNLCGKGFARREYLNMHMNVHQGQTAADVKFLQCDHCHKKFTRQQVLDKHMEFHSPARRFDCQTCGLRFKTRPGLAAHAAAHTANRPFVCAVCSKGFKSSAALKAHEVVHTGERKFSCTECDKTFNNLSSLHKHALVHNEDNPYKCEVCHQTFKYSSNFTRHLRQHLQTSSS